MEQIKQQTIESIRPSQVQLETYQYSTADDATKVWDELAAETQTGIAVAYKKAFAGPPWFEVGLCACCGRYTNSMEACNNQECGNTDTEKIGEAYYIDELVNGDLAFTMSQFTPNGILSIVKTNTEIPQVIGAAMGGETSLGNLISTKYKLESPRKIVESIISTAYDKFGLWLSNKSKLFYENEAFIDPDFQQKGIGRKLQMERLMNATDRLKKPILIAGRSVNQNWLDVKAEIFSQIGYDMVCFVPEGDNYQADGKPRQFFLAKPRDINIWRPDRY